MCINRVEKPSLMNTHKHDETLNDYGGGKFEEQEKENIAGKFFRTTDNIKLKYNK